MIEKIKAPLKEAIIIVGGKQKGNKLLAAFRTFKAIWQVYKTCKLYPEPTKANTAYATVHNLLDLEEKFFQYNKIKPEMFRAAWRIGIAECAHDLDYRYPFEWFVEKLVEKVMSGEWQPRLEDCPNPTHWKEPPPYGGKHSIIYKLQAHREEILKLIGE